ncbi:MAG: molybdopterin-dependent oxidoreductase [Actinomycetia bacterium]|nr:molybdopterin-dependent oxidoreductase [Actinomycetes bacterium]
MKKKLIIALVAGSAAIVLAFFIYFIIENEMAKRGTVSEVFEPEDIDISTIGSDLEFAESIPEYEMLFSGLLSEGLTSNFYDILVRYQDRILTFDARGVRTDEEIVEEEFTGINLKYLIEDTDIAEESENVIIYATDLFAAQFSIEEFLGDDIYLVWKKNGQYLSPSGDGILKIVLDNGPTSKWVKNPVLFDFIGPYNDEIPEQDNITSRDVDFISEQNFFTLSLGFIPEIDTDEWALKISGLVQDPLELSYSQILAMPQESVFATLETISNPPGGRSIGNAVWTGVPFGQIMDLVGVKSDVLEVAFFCDDGYSTSITLDEAMEEGVMLAYKMNGQTLSALHGFPVRMVVPEKYGMKWPKWINEIEFVDYDYKGYWEQRGWSDYAGRDRPEERYD